MRLKTNKIQQLIIENVADHPKDITSYASGRLDISRQAAFVHLRALVDKELIKKTGSTKGAIYELVTKEHGIELPVVRSMSESDVWTDHVISRLPELADNVRGICHYGFTGMLNNVIAHSNATRVRITVHYDVFSLSLRIRDNGVGIFNKIQNELGLATPQQSVLELAKGRSISDPERHRGEGIFLASRVFDTFAIVSGGLTFTGRDDSGRGTARQDDDGRGTAVHMGIARNSTRTAQEVFGAYSAGSKGFGLGKTRIPLALMQREGDPLVSRSQAARLLAGLDAFTDVVLDFHGVPFIGQEFADELFRVHPRQHPDVRLARVNASAGIEDMVRHVTAPAASG